MTFVPHGDTGRLLDALAAAGAGHLGDYSRCAFTVAGVGTFRPEPGAHSTIGTVGAVAEVPETRVEMVLPRESRAEVVRALRAVHPYEEPEFDLFELADLPASRGLGRVGRLPRPEPLRDVAVRVAAAVPATPIGVRVAGDLDRVVGTVAVCGGAGDGLLPAVRGAGAEVFVTADLRHHPASEAVADGRLALVDAGHWATEWLWLTEAARRLEAALAERGTTVSTRVSRIVTDPWTLHLPSPRSTH